MNCRADRAKIVRLVRRMVRRILLGRGRFRRRHARNGRAACELFEMNVSKRKGELQRHRRKGEPTAPPPIGTNRTHWQNWPTSLSVVYTGVDPGQCHQFEYITRIGRRYVARLPELVALLLNAIKCGPHAAETVPEPLTR